MGKRKTNGDTATLAGDSLRINTLTIENWLGIKFAQVDAGGKHVHVEGRNGAGKSSVVSSVWCAIKGLSRQQYPEAVHDGEDRARITLDLGELTIVRTITAKGMDLEVTMADGTPVDHKPQAFLDKLIPALGFDLGRFMGMTPKEQVKAFLEFIDLKAPVDEVEKLTGQRHEQQPDESAVDYLARLAADEKGLYYIERRRLHVIATQKEHAWKEQADHLASIGGPLGEEERELSLAELVGQQQQLAARAEERRQRVAAATQAAQLVSDAHEQFADDQAAEARLVQELEAVRAKLERGKLFIAKAMTDKEKAEQAVTLVPDPASDIARIKQQLATAETQNAAIRKRQHAQQALDRLQVEHKDAEAEHEAADKLLESLRGLWTHLLDGAKVGIDGLEVGDGELRLKGRPFRQASEGERLIAGFGIYRLQTPKPPFLLFDGAERLDPDNQALLRKLADEDGCQVLSTAVAKGPLRIECVG